MRVAICLSGQTRTWKSSISNIRRYFHEFSKSHTVDYFYHTWDVNTYRSEPHFIRQEYFYDIEHFKSQISQEFDVKSFIIEEYDDDKYGLNWSSLFWSFLRSIELKRQYEDLHNFNYDLVIKLRFDMGFFESDTFRFDSEVKHKTLYSISDDFYRFPIEFDSPTIDDVMFFGNSYTMDVLSNIYYWNINELRMNVLRSHRGQSISAYNNYGPGSLIYNYALMCNLSFKFHHISYFIVRRECDERGITALSNNNECYQLSRTYWDKVAGK